MKAEKTRQITLRLTPEDISLVKDCDAIQLKIVSTTGDIQNMMWVYTDKFLNKLGYE